MAQSIYSISFAVVFQYDDDDDDNNVDKGNEDDRYLDSSISDISLSVHTDRNSRWNFLKREEATLYCHSFSQHNFLTVQYVHPPENFRLCYWISGLYLFFFLSLSLSFRAKGNDAERQNILPESTKVLAAMENSWYKCVHYASIHIVISPYLTLIPKRRERGM